MLKMQLTIYSAMHLKENFSRCNQCTRPWSNNRLPARAFLSFYKFTFILTFYFLL